MNTSFSSKNGMATKEWGGKLWDSLFTMILGSYPSKLNDTKEHSLIKDAFIHTLSGLQYTIPCSYCRESYKIFYKETPIEMFTDSRINMMYWLYLIKDQVNKKLIFQELEHLTSLYKKFKKGKMTKKQYEDNVKNCFVTTPSPPFIDVLEKYESSRAVCSKKLKKCIKK